MNGSRIDSPTKGILQAQASGNASAEIFPDDPLQFVGSEQIFRLDNQTSISQISSVANLSDILTVSGPIASPTTIRVYLTGFGSVDTESQIENGPLPTDATNGFTYINVSAQTYKSGTYYSTVKLSNYQSGAVIYSTDIENTTKGGSVLDGGTGGVYLFAAYVDVRVTDQHRTIDITEEGVTNPAMSGNGTIHDDFEANLLVDAPAGLTNY